MTQPDIRGDRIVFAWEGDLYSTASRAARRSA